MLHFWEYLCDTPNNHLGPTSSRNFQHSSVAMLASTHTQEKKGKKKSSQGIKGKCI